MSGDLQHPFSTQGKGRTWRKEQRLQALRLEGVPRGRKKPVWLKNRQGEEEGQAETTENCTRSRLAACQACCLHCVDPGGSCNRALVGPCIFHPSRRSRKRMAFRDYPGSHQRSVAKIEVKARPSGAPAPADHSALLPRHKAFINGTSPSPKAMGTK